ncbi:zinc finger TRAF-type-containing protein 1-B-like isoform X2 [Zophobas morio]|uniref:zinc finger TRAF-type-containing protein 1-B-like isoform X2 n=1 Tax=Zophobas morio TaxID=2755281 RepID=UPI003083D4B6
MVRGSKKETTKNKAKFRKTKKPLKFEDSPSSSSQLISTQNTSPEAKTKPLESVKDSNDTASSSAEVEVNKPDNTMADALPASHPTNPSVVSAEVSLSSTKANPATSSSHIKEPLTKRPKISRDFSSKTRKNNPILNIQAVHKKKNTKPESSTAMNATTSSLVPHPLGANETSLGNISTTGSTKFLNSANAFRVLNKLANSNPSTPLSMKSKSTALNLSTVSKPGGQSIEALQELLNCNICFMLPETEIYQCPHGHLLCRDCHQRVISEDVSVCPTCRVGMSRLHPSRNTIAESARDQLPIACPNSGCTEILTYNSVKQHAEQECLFRTVNCQYDKLGCSWKDVVSKKETHETECEFQNMLGKDILSHVKLKEDSQKEAETETKAAAELCKRIMDLLSCRCRQVIVRDVRLERDAYDHTICSTPFSGLGEKFVVRVRKKSRSRPLGLQVERIDRLSLNRLPLNIVIMKGPSLALDLLPSIHKCYFKANVHRSRLLPLPLNEAEGKRFIECHQIHLRLIFIDQRAGLERRFTSLRDTPAVDGGLGEQDPGNISMTDSEGDDRVGDDPAPSANNSYGNRYRRRNNRGTPVLAEYSEDDYDDEYTEDEYSEENDDEHTCTAQ